LLVHVLDLYVSVVSLFPIMRSR